jgi:lysophospholipase L1-like esterase
MLWLARWVLIFGAHAQDVGDLSQRFAPPGWQGNAWGPAATRARADGRVLSIAMTPEMTRWDKWGRTVLQDGDIVFRMGDARILYGFFPFSRFLAGASGSRFSHAGIVAVEDGAPVVYDCTKPGVGRTPFAVWILDNVGAFGVKRLKPERRWAIPGVLAFCRNLFQEQASFDYSFDLDDSAFYCLEMTEKAFRSQGQALSEPVRLGDMENATRYPICMSLFVSLSKIVLKRPLTLEQAVYMPGNGRHGLWASRLLEPVFPPSDDRTIGEVPRQDGGISLGGDLAIVAGIAYEFGTSDRLRSQREKLFGLGSRAAHDAVVSASVPAALAGYPGGIGVLGDSYSDEYQFSSPDRRPARNWVEILSLTRGLDFGRFSAFSWGGPRGRGFEYNWAQSDATVGDLIAAGQHTGLAAQVARGDVRMVFVFIGGNDFINAMHAPDPESALRTTLPRALADYQIAVGTIRAAAPDVRLVLATVPDIRLLPEFAGLLREGRGQVHLANACTAAMETYNAQIRAMAAGDRRIALIDLALIARLADLVSREFVVVAGRRLDRTRPGDSADRFFLPDRRHPGTLAQAEVARRFILAVNGRFGAGIEPLRDAEILRLADDSLAGPAGSSSSRPGERGAIPDPAAPGPAVRPGLSRGALSSTP